MKLSPSISISSIQETFSEKYPLLKIKFYSKTHKEFEGSWVGGTWLQTSKTDHWTLKKYQKKAEESE